MRYTPRLVLRLACVLLASGATGAVRAHAQPPGGRAPADSVLEVRLPDGGRVAGWITREWGDSLVFQSATGMVYHLDRRFVSFRRAGGRVVDGTYWPEDRNLSRLFFAPTGRTLRADEGYLGLFLIVPFVGYGVNDALTLAAGIPPLPFGKLANTPFWVAPKLRVLNRPRAQLSLGALVANLPDWDWDDEDEIIYAPGPYLQAAEDDDEITRIGVAYAVGTFGDDDRALHVGAGIAHANNGRTRVPLMVGGEYRVSRSVKWLTENWVIPQEGAGSMLGVRRIGERWTADLGLMFLPTEDDVPYFPVASFSYTFGAGR